MLRGAWCKTLRLAYCSRAAPLARACNPPTMDIVEPREVCNMGTWEMPQSALNGLYVYIMEVGTDFSMFNIWAKRSTCRT